MHQVLVGFFHLLYGPMGALLLAFIAFGLGCGFSKVMGSYAWILVPLGALALAATPAYAQSGNNPTVDYTPMVNAVQTQVTSAITAVGPLVFGIFGTILTVGLLMVILRKVV